MTSTIYDSIYGICLATPEVVHWLNQNIVPILVKDFMIDQTVHNEANLEVGLNWADLHTLANDATIDDITALLQEISNDH